MNKLLLIFSLCALTAQSSAQNDGFYNRSWVVGLNGFGNIPLLNGFFADNVFRQKGNQMVPSREWFNYGLELYAMRSLSERRALGIEFSSKVFGAPTPKGSSLLLEDGDIAESSDIYYRMEQISLLSRAVFFRAEFTGTNGVSPVGFTHLLAAGINFTGLHDYSLAYQLTDLAGNATSDVDVLNIREGWVNYKSIALQYGLFMRYPFTEKLALDVGVKYWFNYYIKPNDEDFIRLNNKLVVDYEAIYYEIRRKNFMSMQAKIGFAYIF